MASKKKKRPAPASKAKMAHSDTSKEHEVHVTVTIGPIGPLERKTKRKSHRGRKAAPKQVKAFLKWVLTQL